MPNTNINLPVVQSPDDDYYYLSHGPDGNHDVFGSAYVELCNKPDFTDPVTVIYGHNMLDDSMFATTHYFEDREFFDKNDHFYIYTPGHILTYKIISAYAGNDEHIINTNKGFQNKDVLLKYYEFICNPTALIKNVRGGIKLDEHDKVVQLSTCMSDLDWSNQRYLVTGYLIDDVETN